MSCGHRHGVFRRRHEGPAASAEVWGLNFVHKRRMSTVKKFRNLVRNVTVISPGKLQIIHIKYKERENIEKFTENYDFNI